MPLSLDTLLAQAANSGSFNAASGTASLGSSTTAGNTVLIFCTTRAGSMNTPSGFVAADTPATQLSTTKVYVFRRSNVPAGESSWTISPASSSLVVWIAWEAEGLDPTAPLDVGLSTTVSTTSGTSVSSGTTARTTTYDGVPLAVYAAWDAASTTPTTFSGYTNTFAEVTEAGGDNGTGSLGLAVAGLATQQLGTQTATATASKTLTATNSAGSFLVVYSAQGAKREANIAFLWAFKVGVGAAGLGNGNSADLFPASPGRYIETVVGTPAITADGLQLASTAAAESAATPIIGFLATPQLSSYVIRVRFRFDGSLPSVDTDLVATTGVNALALRYVTASQKLGFKLSTGTEVLSDATVAADTWYGVDLRMFYVSPNQTGDWQVDYGAGPVAQAQATFAGAPTNGTVRLGWTGAITVPGVTFGYLLVSKVAGHYPLGDYTMLLLKVDPATTPTISGTAGNFGVMTANATIAAWDATNARDAVDDWPPTVGGSADGAVAVTAHTSDYIEFPLETYDAASAGARVQAARVVLPMWAASGTAATCRVSGYDGTAATTLFTEADPAADNSSTPAWICNMWRPTNGWDQTKLDAAAIRFGSNDATPDLGPHAVGMEIAVKPGDTMPLFGDLAAQKVDPVSAGILAVTVTNPADRASTLHTEYPSATDTAVGQGATQTVTLDAPDAPSATMVAIYPDPEPTPPT